MWSLPWADIRYSLRRSRVRLAVLFAIEKLGAGYVSDLARVAGVAPQRVHAALFGDDETYRQKDGLLALGLVVSELVKGQLRFRLTPFGEQVAREVRADLARERETSPRSWT